MSCLCSSVFRALGGVGSDDVLEVLSFEVHADERDTEDFIGSIFHKVEKVLVKPGRSTLK